MNTERIKEIFSDKEFVLSLMEMKSAEEAQVLLEQKGMELTVEQVEKVQELFLKVKNGEITPQQLESMRRHAEDGELSEDDLENVAGGVFVLDDIVHIALVALVVVGVIALIGYTAIAGTDSE